MNRAEFEALRDLPDKKIEQNIGFSNRVDHSHIYVADNIAINNSLGHEVKLTIQYNREVGTKTFNVTLRGVGPICRLCVDGPAHKPAGRSHKHSLQTDSCPRKKLPDDVDNKPEFSGQSLNLLFNKFCAMAKIEFAGEFERVDENE